MLRCKEDGLAVIAALTAVIASVIFYSSFALNHDASWFLVSTRKFLDGAVLYRDIVETNPPLAFYLTVPALTLADLFNITTKSAFVLYVSLLGGFSVVWVHRLVKQAELTSVAVMIATGSAIAINFIIVVQEFGQREHFLLVFALPYFTYLIFRDRLKKISGPEQIAIGLVAFLGLALKPYFLVIPATMIFVRLYRNRDYREIISPANIALGLAHALYVGAIFALHPRYFDEVVPRAMLVYASYGRSALGVFAHPEFLALPALALLALSARKNLDAASSTMLGGLAGGLLCYFVQFKGWNYQILPASAFIFLSATWITYSNAESVRRNVALGIMCMISVCLSLGAQVWQGPAEARTTEQFERYITGPEEKVLVLSSNLWAAFPFVNDVEAIWASRYPAQWLLPGAVSFLNEADCIKEVDICAQYRGVLDSARSDIVEDLINYKPQLVYIDDRQDKSHFRGTRFDYLQFLSASPAFQMEWIHYNRIGRVSELGYEVYERR